MENVGLFAYGEMGKSALENVSKSFNVSWIFLPPKKFQTIAEEDTDKIARLKKIPVYYETSFDEIKKIIKSNSVSIVVICSFNKIVPKGILSLTKFMNVHLGDLPKYRGRANVNWALINGLDKMIISVHEVVPGLDSGRIYAKFSVKIQEVDSVGDIYIKINKTLESKLDNVIKKVLKGDKGKPQKGTATYCSTRLPEDGYIDWSKTTKEIYNLIRAVTKPYPGAFTFYKNKKMIIWNSEIPKKPKKYVGRIPGRVIEIHKEGVEVLTKDSSLIIKNINYGGKDLNSSLIIKSVKSTLGVNIEELLNKLN